MPVKIDLNHQYLSIGTLTCPDLPDFAVLTGRNGSGKTQLLQAIARGDAVVSGFPTNEIELYDMNSFRPPDNKPGNRTGTRTCSLGRPRATTRQATEARSRRSTSPKGTVKLTDFLEVPLIDMPPKSLICCVVSN